MAHRFHLEYGKTSVDLKFSRPAALTRCGSSRAVCARALGKQNNMDCNTWVKGCKRARKYACVHAGEWALSKVINSLFRLCQFSGNGSFPRQCQYLLPHIFCCRLGRSPWLSRFSLGALTKHKQLLFVWKGNGDKKPDLLFNFLW